MCTSIWCRKFLSKKKKNLFSSARVADTTIWRIKGEDEDPPVLSEGTKLRNGGGKLRWDGR